MKNTLPTARPSLPALLLLCAGLGACASDGGARASAAPEPAAFDMEAIMAKTMEYATPGEAHAGLAQNAGHWTVAGHYFMEPGGEPQPMTATADIELLLGGRMTHETFQSDFGGMPFEGILLQGYDNLKGEHWSMWFDNMSTWGSYSSGSYDASGDLVLEGTMHDAMTPEGRLFRTVLQRIDDDHAGMKMYDVAADGSAALTMELNYTRAE